MVHQKKDGLITDMFTVSEERTRLGNYIIKSIENEEMGRCTVLYTDYGKSEPKSFSIVGDKLYLDGEKLPYVTKFSLDFGEEDSTSGCPVLEVKGLLEEDGKPMVRFGEFVGYTINEHVEVLGGDSNE